MRITRRVARPREPRHGLHRTCDRYATQQDRADADAVYVTTLHQASWVVGDFWFEYVDEPAGGRFDGEDSNFGVVSTSDVPWEMLVDRMTQIHATSPDRQERIGCTEPRNCARGNAGSTVGG